MSTFRVGTTNVEIVRGDITAHAADAIVNAANYSLLGGGGVDGAIHRKGGPEILEECRKIVARIGRCPTGEAVATTAGRLPAKIVVHTVGPVWQGGGAGEDTLLARCWTRSLEVGAERGARTIAFPAISTGAYGYPIDRAARVSLGALAAFLRSHPGAFDAVSVVLFREADSTIWNAAAGALLGRIHDAP